MATRKELKRALARYQSVTNWQQAYVEQLREVQAWIQSAPFRDALAGDRTNGLRIEAGSLAGVLDGQELTYLELETIDDQQQASVVYRLLPGLYTIMVKQLQGMIP